MDIIGFAIMVWCIRNLRKSRQLKAKAYGSEHSDIVRPLWLEHSLVGVREAKSKNWEGAGLAWRFKRKAIHPA